MSRVAIVSVGDPRSPGTWSGVTAGVCGGLAELGVEVLPVDLSSPSARERALLAAGALPTRNRYDAEAAALVARVRSLRAQRALAGTGTGIAGAGQAGAGVAGAIQIGTTFSLPAGLRYVTLEDMTLRQALEVHPVFSRMSSSAARAWEGRRARIYAGAHACAAASRWTADSLARDYGLGEERVALVGFGANHQPAPVERDWSSPRFLFVGIDWERKGGPLLLRAFARVREALPEAALDVIGGHPPLRQEGVRFHGVLSQQREDERERVRELFAAATCFAMPSQVEPFGIVYVEAAAAGLPSIGSTVGGGPDVIGVDGGAVVAPGDEDALVRAMLRLADPDTARRAGAAARERSSLYTWRAVAGRLLRALELPAPGGDELPALL